MNLSKQIFLFLLFTCLLSCNSNNDNQFHLHVYALFGLEDKVDLSIKINDDFVFQTDSLIGDIDTSFIIPKGESEILIVSTVANVEIKDHISSSYMKYGYLSMEKFFTTKPDVVPYKVSFSKHFYNRRAIL